jgi:glycosyltransferase involved in cell wall biosynthesis
MRILLCTSHRRDPAAGVAGVQASLAAALRAKGHDVAEIYGDTFTPYVSAHQASTLYTPPVVAAFARFWSPDIVDVHLGSGWLLPGRRLVARSHGLEHAHWRLLRTEPGLSRRFRLFMTAYRLPTVRRTVARAAAVIAASSADASSFALLNLSRPPAIDVIPHGLSREWLQRPRRPERRGGGARLLYVGNWSHTKGADRLPSFLEALLRLGGQEIELTAVTSCDARWIREVALADLPAASVRVSPPVSQGELQALMSAHDVLLVPSRYEPFGRVVGEAMAKGMLVATPRSCGAGADLIRHRENGLHVDYDRPEDAARELLTALPDVRDIGSRAMDSVAHLSWDWVAGRTLCVYERVLSQNRHQSSPTAALSVSAGDVNGWGSRRDHAG